MSFSFNPHTGYRNTVRLLPYPSILMCTLSKCLFRNIYQRWGSTTVSSGLQRWREQRRRSNCPAACQIPSRQPKDSSRHQSEDCQNRSRLQTASASTANCAACITRLYEHVSKTAASGDAVMAARRHGNDDSSWSRPVDTSKSQTDLEFPCLKITFEAIKMAEFPLQEHLGIIALPDFKALCWSCQVSNCTRSSSPTENIKKVIICDWTFTEAHRPLEPFLFLLFRCESRPWTSETGRRDDVTGDLYMYVVSSSELCSTDHFCPHICERRFHRCQIFIWQT